MSQDKLIKPRPARRPEVVPDGTLVKFRAISSPNSRKGKSRIFHTKVKTGCRTCKLRKVKCDERKPNCARCQTFGVDCDGYPLPEKFPAPSIYSRRKVLPKTFLPQQSHGPPLRFQPLVPLFKSEQDYQYYIYFRDDTSHVLSSGFDTSLWDRVVLQACEAEPSLRQLTISLAALNKESRPDGAGSLHWTYARTQYGKALKSIRESLSGRQESDSARIALVAALLIFCFENQYGDPVLALAHIQSALGLLRKQIPARRRRSYKHLKNISPTADFEYELVSTFARLDNQIIARIEHVDPTRIYILEMPYHDDDFDIPEAFRNTTEARSYLEHFQFRACPCVPHNFLSDVRRDPQTLDQFLQGQDVLPFESFQPLSLQHGQWNKAFRPLFERSRTAEGRKDFLAATILRIQSVSTDLLLRATHFTSRNNREKDLSGQAREIIFLSRRAIAHPDFRKTFVFEIGILPSLMCVLMTCVERGIREDIAGIARDVIPRREGLWDSLLIAEVGERMLQMDDKSRSGSPDMM